jgi:acyl-coenzyme A thioesterase PaaI-like protein
MTVPDDFQAHDRSSPVTDPGQPLFARWRETACDLGFVLGPAHCNARGMLHGGVIAALSDNAMGLSLGQAWKARLKDSPPQSPSILTSNLSLDYLGIAKLGDWICINPRVVHVGNKSGNVDALISAHGKVIARANASFRILI